MDKNDKGLDKNIDKNKGNNVEFADEMNMDKKNANNRNK